MDTNLITTIITGAVSLINVIIVVFLLIKKNKTTNETEKEQLSNIINQVMPNTISNIKTLCENAGICYNKKTVAKVASNSIKKEATNETQNNA